MTGLAYALALVTGLGLAQCLAGWILVARFAARVTTPPARFPPVTILKPQKRKFWVQKTDNSKAAISVNWARDLFVAMGDPLGESAWSMRIQYKPLVRYIWLGALVMAIGGFIAATDRRYRVKVPATASDAVAAPPGGQPKPGIA